VTDELLEELALVTDQLLARLAAQAQQEKPRFFAICGMYVDPPAMEGEDPTYVEWGMEFPDQSLAIMCDRTGQTTSSSAEQILKQNAKMGPARLIWLDQ
jgi:hypothetical protein